MVGEWTGVCRWCHETGSGPINVPYRKEPEMREEERREREDEAYRRWLEDAENGSWVDS